LAAAALPLVAMLIAVPAIAADSQASSAQFAQVDAGISFTCALDAGGNAFCWGSGGNGKLGNGGTADRWTPVPVKAPAGVTFRQLDVGASDTCALGSDAKAYCWGPSFYGVPDRLVPEPLVPPPGVTYTQVSTGSSHTCALGNDSKAYCWGFGVDGRLGDGTATHYRATPEAVTNPPGVTFTRISAGYGHTCAIGNDTKTYCWGSNSYGRVGDGTTTDRLSPVPVDAPTGVTLAQLTMGQAHTCGIGSDSKTYCWGWNSSGQLGTGSSAEFSSIPEAVSTPAGVTFTRVSVDYNTSCALGDDSKTYCWGWVFNTNHRTPVAVNTPTGVSFTQISTGSDHNCAIGNDTKTYCWGMGHVGQLGNNQTADRPDPVEVLAVQSSSGPSGTAVQFVRVATGNSHSCAIGNDSNTYCWGMNDSGYLGNGTTAGSPTPVPVNRPMGVIFTDLAIGEIHTCAIGNDSKTYCWGSNGSGELGDGSINQSRYTPTPVSAPPGVTFTQVAAGRSHTCALGNDSRAYCWGQGGFGQLTNGTYSGSPIPTQVNTPAGVTFTRITTGGYHTCALGNDSKTYCWGYNADGTLGIGSTTEQTNPVPVNAPPGVLLTDPAAGYAHTCASGNNAQAYCWGAGGFGQLGNGGVVNQTVPIAVNAPGGVTLTGLATGSNHTCALGTDSKTYCWGDGSSGQLGNGATAQQTNPVAVNVPGGVILTQLSSGTGRTCGLGNNGKAYCWGYGGNGQLGDGGMTDQSTPVEVVGASAGGDRMVNVTWLDPAGPVREYQAVCRGCGPRAESRL
jgi:alpha-tubulin suppressor-like RCC1 family protein